MLDFGVARKQDEAGEQGRDGSSFTLLGTPEYMAPEQVASGIVDDRADVYALGCVLYEMVTGRLPHVAESTVALIDTKIKQDPDAPRDRAPARGIPIEVDRLIMRALVRDPTKRTESAERFLSEIHAAIDAPQRRRARRRNLGRLALAVSLVAAMLSLTTALARRYPDQMHLAMSMLVAPVSSDETADETAEGTEPLNLAVSVPKPDPAPEEEDLALEATPLPEGKLLEQAADLAERAAQRRDWPAAIQAARDWVDTSHSRQSRLFLARLLLHVQQEEEAHGLLEELGSEQPDCQEVQSLLQISRSANPVQEDSEPKGRVARR